MLSNTMSTQKPLNLQSYIYTRS